MSLFFQWEIVIWECVKSRFILKSKQKICTCKEFYSLTKFQFELYSDNDIVSIKHTNKIKFLYKCTSKLYIFFCAITKLYCPIICCHSSMLLLFGKQLTEVIFYGFLRVIQEFCDTAVALK